MQDRLVEAGQFTGEPGIAVQRVAVAGEPVDQRLIGSGGQGDPRVGFAVGELRGGRALAGLAAEAAGSADHQGGQRLGDLCAGVGIAAAGAQDDDAVLALALVLDVGHLGDHR